MQPVSILPVLPLPGACSLIRNATSYYLYLSTDADFSGCIPILVQATPLPVAYAVAGFWALLFVCSFVFLYKKKLIYVLSMIVILIALTFVSCQLGGGKSTPDTIDHTTTQNGLAPDTTYTGKLKQKTTII